MNFAPAVENDDHVIKSASQTDICKVHSGGESHFFFLNFFFL